MEATVVIPVQISVLFDPVHELFKFKSTMILIDLIRFKNCPGILLCQMLNAGGLYLHIIFTHL